MGICICICVDCEKEWLALRPSWWCDECRKKHLPNMRDVLKKKGGE